MASLDVPPSATFPADILQCDICFKITSLNSMVLCKNGHVVCKPCRKKMKEKDCGTCRGAYDDKPMINILKKILTTLQIECKFKTLGCSSQPQLSNREDHELNCQFRNVCKFDEDGCIAGVINAEDRAAHEQKCEYRQVFCYDKLCQSKQISFTLKPNATGLTNHYNSKHSPGTGSIRRITIEDPSNFEISGTGLLKGITILSNISGKALYIFASDVEIEKINHSVKACLISTMIPSEANKWQCEIFLGHQGQEISNCKGKLFSVDDTRNIHSIYAGGLIYPKELNHLNYEEITFRFNLTEY